MNSPVTIRQIAQAAGVNSSTVSRALRNDRTVSAETCQRIQKLAAELGYKPNPMVSALMASRIRLRKAPEQQILAYLHSFSPENSWRKYATLVDYFEGARERAAQFGYQLEEFWVRNGGVSSRKMSDILYCRDILGVIIAPMPNRLGHLSLQWDHFSAAALGYSMARPLMHRAVPDHLLGIRSALRHLRKLGYRRIGLVLSRSQDARCDGNWTAGYAEYFLLQPARTRIAPFLHSSFDPLKFRRWLDAARPDAIISGNPNALKWMQDAGLGQPHNFGFAMLDRPADDDQYAGVYLDGRAVGAAAADLVIGQLNRNERGLPAKPIRTIVASHWLDGRSAPPR
jgi:LacI family transcriptional regulator